MVIGETISDSKSSLGGDAEDSAKRRQIIEGASRAFMARGFNGASMGEIARVAGVSKGTLYVYFQSKEQLFEACIEEKRRTKFNQLLDFDPSAPLADELTRFGTNIARFLTSPEVIMAMRAVIGIAEQMPELGERFYDKGPARTAAIFATFLDLKVQQGVIEIADTRLAATQFTDMCQSTLVRPLLFGCALSEQERERRIASAVSAAVDMFLKAHGKAL